MGPYIRKMNLQRGKEGLGFILTGQNPCVISSVNQNSPAIQAGLKTGDEILEVNSIDVSKLNHDEVVKHILKYTSIYIELKVRTFPTPTKKDIQYTTYNNCNSETSKETNSGNSNNDQTPMITKKTKVKSFTIENKFCSCDNTIVPVARRDARNAKVINGDVNKLSNRRAFRYENYPEKKKNNRPCSFAAPSSETNSLCIIHEFKENQHDIKTNGHVTGNRTTEPLADKYSKFESPKISSLNPKASSTVRRVPHKNSEEIKLDRSFIVSYQCTIDLPEEDNQNICDAGIHTLNSCVEKIQNEAEDISSIVLLSIGTMGVKLTNPIGNNIVTYPLNTVLYNFICSEDTRFFGLITRKLLTDHSADMSSSYKHSPRFSRSREVVLCSCHVFMVDPNLANHDIHLETALLFGVSCKQVLGICQQFPETPSVVLMELNSFYKKRDSVSCYSLSSLAISDTVSADKNTISSTLERLRSKAGTDPNSPDKSKTFSTLERSRGKSLTGTVSPEKTLSASTLDRARNRTISDSVTPDKPISSSTLGRPNGTNGIDSEHSSRTLPRGTFERYEKVITDPSPNEGNVPSQAKEKCTVNNRDEPVTPVRHISKTLDRTPKKSDTSTPDKIIISNTLERIRGNVSNSSTPRDPRKLMIGPPSSLIGLNDEEKKELIREIEERKSSQSDEDELVSSDYFQVNNNDTLFRRKSATESELFGNLKSNQTSIQALISSNLTQSLRSEYRKPPAPQRMYSVPKNLSDMSSTTLLNGLKKTPRRKSEAPTFSPKTSLKELFFKSNMKKRKKDTPPSNTRFYLKRDTNENVKQLSTSSASSELSLDGKAGRVEGWAQSLEKLLADAVGLRCFQEFLKKEFSEENLLFWVACERFKRMTDIMQMKNMAHEISRNYLSGNAPFLVNVDSVAVKKTETELNTPHADMFNIPQQQVFQLMKFDSYNRFLKSTLYQECLLAENSDRLFPYEDEMDGELRKNPLWVKSMKSPISDTNEKRKNPLNFLNRGKNVKSPDPDKVRKERSSSLGAYDECNRKNVIYPAEMNGHTPKDNQLWEGTQSKSRIVRVIMPDGTSGVIVGERGQTLREGLKELAEQKNFPLQSIDVTVGYEKRIANLDSDISSLQENIVYLERRVLLRFDLPNGRSVGVKSSPNKSLRDVLQPVMKTNGFDLENYSVLLINTKIPLPLDSCVSSVENKRLVTKLNHRKLEKQNSDSAVSRMGAQGFRASFRKFRTNSNNFTEGKDDKSEGGRKMTRKKSDDGAAALMTVLQKSQSSRLDDQRGMISRDIEIPDFLKVTSSTPSPVRNKIVNTVNNNFHSSPLKTVHQYPGTPFIVDKNFKDLTEKLDLSLSAPLNSRGRPSLCSVRSWKELPSPDRELVDRSYTFDTSFSMDRTRVSADSINALSPATNNKIALLELSKSDSSLLTRDSLINVSRSSTEPNCSPGNSQKYISSKSEAVKNGNSNNDDDECFRDRSVSCDTNFKKRNERRKELNKNNIRCNDVPIGGRPLPINKFNESEVLRCLDQTDSAIVTTPEKKNTQLCDKSMERRQDSGIDTNPSNSDNNLNNTNTDSESKDRSAKSTPTKFGLTLDTPKAQSTERIGSVDIVDYDLSPRALERYRKLSLSDDMLMNSVNREVFEANAIPTPEKGKLLKGETIRGRQNEKITFV